jgi:RNA polymerase sigma-70 factor (ECF subfamily)
MRASSPEQRESENSITALLNKLTQGKREAEAELISRVYEELRRLARHYMQLERKNHTLQPTALVHEAYARLVQQPNVAWQGRTHFFATASKVMRHVLVDHARAHRAGKRGGAQQQITLDEALLPSNNKPIDVIAMHEALERLAVLDQRQAKVVELRWFGGLSFAEIASLLEIGERTAKLDWSMARAWLKGELSKST